MIHWFDFTIHIPLPVPTLGIVAAWLVIGNAMLAWLAASTAFNRSKGYAPHVAKDSAAVGLVATCIIVMAWPLAAYLQVREAIRRRASS